MGGKSEDERDREKIRTKRGSCTNGCSYVPAILLLRNHDAGGETGTCGAGRAVDTRHRQARHEPVCAATNLYNLAFLHLWGVT